MNGTVLDLVSDTVNNKLYAGGSFTFSGSEFTPYISVWDGTKWAGLGTGMNGPVHALCMYKGNLYAGGITTSPYVQIPNGRYPATAGAFSETYNGGSDEGYCKEAVCEW